MLGPALAGPSSFVALGAPVEFVRRARELSVRIGPAAGNRAVAPIEEELKSQRVRRQPVSRDGDLERAEVADAVARVRVRD